jgi:hypothetical protein
MLLTGRGVVEGLVHVQRYRATYHRLAGEYISSKMTRNTHLAMLRIGAQRKEFGLWSGRLKVQT